ncbi:ABC transporter permease [Paenibacillus hodogayensis]|uniref:ABC transporter permease n=1 Tax=Paenibacillus hodogayensis TaxID=279208 RepID=A0ABV5VQR0_9BACL
MRAYYSVLKLRLILGMQYRAAALAGVATQFFFGFLYIMLFEAFYAQSGVEPPMSFPELVTYLWLKQAFLAFVVLWFRDNELFNLITTGNIAYELCRPADIYGYWYAKLIAQRLSSALLRCLPILLVAMLLPKPYRMTVPSSWTTFALFVVSLLLGLMLLVAIGMFIYLSVFYTMSPTGSILLFGVLGEFLAGMVVPVPMMPDWMQNIVVCLPFHLTGDFPFRVYSGHIAGSAVGLGIVQQLIWLAALLVLGRVAFGRALRRVVIQGG